MNKPLINFRALDPKDRPFVLNSWLRSYRKESQFGREITADVYYNNHKAVVTELLDRSEVLVVCNPEVEFQLYGYIVYEKRRDALVIHFAYVKLPYRNLGLAKTMMAMIQGQYLAGEDLPIVVTHATQVFHKLARKWRLTYNPYLQRSYDAQDQDPIDIQRREMRERSAKLL